MRIRQAVALGVLVILLILIVLGVNSCQDSRTKNALKSYNRDVTAVMTSSDREVMRPFFQLMSNGAQEGQDLQVQVNQLRQAADDNASRARGFSVPGDMADAQHALLEVLDFRAQGLRNIAAAIPVAQGRGQPASNAVARIAANMQFFLASDVVHSQRVVPYLNEALRKNGVGGQSIYRSQSMKDLSWLSPQVVADRLGSGAAGTTGTTGTPAPGLHGHGLTSVSVGTTTLQPGTVVNRVPAQSPVFKITFQNQGDNNERNVPVTLTVRGAGAPITAKKTVPTTTAKQPVTTTITLPKAPPRGQATTVEVVIGRVPGEKNTDNNKQTYTVLFQ